MPSTTNRNTSNCVARRLSRRSGALATLLTLPLALAACGAPQQRPAPQRAVAPYDTTHGEVLWAVVPLRNESGTTDVDPAAIGDKVVAAAQEVEGIACLPLNRTIAAMRALGMEQVSTPAEARRLAEELGVDALVVGSVTAWDPYDPPTIGLSLVLYARTLGMHRAGGLDARALSYAETDFGVAGFDPRLANAPVGTVSLHLDARDSGVLSRVREHAEGRADPATALGWRRYLMDMDWYASFVAQRGVDRLLETEWLRLARMRSADVAAGGEL